jgi:ATP-dependent protease ClpP protease subunit
MIPQPTNVAQLRAAWRAAHDDPEDTSSGWRMDAAGETPRLYIFGMIGGYRMNAEAFVKTVHALTAPRVAVHINSPGGFVWDGVAMYEALKSSKAHVVAHVDGIAASAASFVLQAADERVIALGARTMIHDAGSIAYGPPAELRRAADLGDAISDDIAAIYAERAGGKPAVWRARMSATTWYSAQQSVDAGLVDRVATRKSSTGPDNRSRLIQARHRALTTQGG